MSKLRYKLFAVKDEHLAAYLYSKGCYCADYKDDTFYFGVEPLLKRTLEEYNKKGDLIMKENKSIQIKVRITPTEKKLIDEYIAAMDINLSDFLRMAIKEALPQSAVEGQNE